MSEERWKAVHGIMMTSERIEAYGGIQFTREALEAAASSITSNGLPMHAQHDLARPLRARNFKAFVKNRADGIDELRFTAELHPDDAPWAESLGAVSVTMTVPIDREDGYSEPTASMLAVSADHAWFTDEAILDAEATFILAGIDPELITAERALQFSFVPDPQIFVSVAMDLLTGVGSSALWAGIAGLFRNRRTPSGGDSGQPTKVNVTVLNGDRSVTAVVETTSEAVAMRAVEGLGDLVRSMRADEVGSAEDVSAVGPSAGVQPVVVWNDQARDWVPPT